MTGSPVKPQTLTEEQAIDVASAIRDKLIVGAKMIEADAATLTSVAAYEKLYHYHLFHQIHLNSIFLKKQLKKTFTKLTLPDNRQPYLAID